MGLVGDCGKFVSGILLSTGRPGIRHHPARSAALDEIDSMLDLVAHRLAHLVDPVSDSLFERQRHDVGSKRTLGAGIEMSTRGNNGVACRVDPWTVDPTGVDRVAQGDVEHVASGLHEQSEVADGREPGAQRPHSVVDGPQGHLGWIEPNRIVETGAGPAQHEIDLHVHEPRDERQLRKLYQLVGVARGAGVGAHLGDAVALDADITGVDDLAAVDVEHAPCVEDGHGRFGHLESFRSGFTVRSAVTAQQHHT